MILVMVIQASIVDLVILSRLELRSDGRTLSGGRDWQDLFPLLLSYTLQEQDVLGCMILCNNYLYVKNLWNFVR